MSADTGTSHATEGKIFLGYSFDRHFAVEAGYATLGKATASGLATSGFAFLPINLSYKMTAPYIDAVGTLPLNEKWSLLGRVGVASSRTSASVSIDGLGVSGPSKTKLGEKFGAGIGYNFNSKVTVRAEWESYRMPDPFIDESFRVNAAVLSAIFHF